MINIYIVCIPACNNCVYCICQVHIEFTEGEDKILVEGPPEEVDQAVKALQEFVQDLVSICVQFFTNLAIDFNGYYPNLLILLIKGYGKKTCFSIL